MHIAAKKVANLSLYLEPKFSQKNFKGYGEKIFKLDESNYYQRRTKFLESVDLYYLNRATKLCLNLSGLSITHTIKISKKIQYIF